MNVTWPVNISLQDWFDQVALDLDTVDLVGKLPSDEDWREYGAHLCNLGRINQKNVPNPYEFEDWQTWADLFVRSVI